jgi:hypothetical protein
MCSSWNFNKTDVPVRDPRYASAAISKNLARTAKSAIANAALPMLKPIAKSNALPLFSGIATIAMSTTPRCASTRNGLVPSVSYTPGSGVLPIGSTSTRTFAKHTKSRNEKRLTRNMSAPGKTATQNFGARSITRPRIAAGLASKALSGRTREQSGVLSLRSTKAGALNAA